MPFYSRISGKNRAAQIASKFLDQDGKFELGFCLREATDDCLVWCWQVVVRIR